MEDIVTHIKLRKSGMSLAAHSSKIIKDMTVKDLISNEYITEMYSEEQARNVGMFHFFMELPQEKLSDIALFELGDYPELKHLTELTCHLFQPIGEPVRVNWDTIVSDLKAAKMVYGDLLEYHVGDPVEHLNNKVIYYYCHKFPRERSRYTDLRNNALQSALDRAREDGTDGDYSEFERYENLLSESYHNPAVLLCDSERRLYDFQIRLLESL